MALIECPDCHAKISSAAPSCPHCGRPAVKSPALRLGKGIISLLVVGAVVAALIIILTDIWDDAHPSPIRPILVKTSKPSATPRPTAAKTPQPIATPTPTSTPSPTPTPTPTPFIMTTVATPIATPKSKVSLKFLKHQDPQASTYSISDEERQARAAAVMQSQQQLNQQQVESRTIRIGDSAAMVLQKWGNPTTTGKRVKDGVMVDVWIYGHALTGYKAVIFRDGKMVAYDDYLPSQDE